MHTYISDITKSYPEEAITQWLGHLDLIWLNVGLFLISVLSQRIGMKINSLAPHNYKGHDRTFTVHGLLSKGGEENLVMKNLSNMSCDAISLQLYISK